MLDLSIGGAIVHIWGWLAAIVIVVGIDLLTIRAARAIGTITVTAMHVRVGGDDLPREAITALEPAPSGFARVLGRGIGEGLPRGAVGLAVRLDDGTVTVIPTRHPDRLRGILGADDGAPDIRPAAPGDLALLPEVARRAETVFRVSGIDLPPEPVVPDRSGRLADRAVFVAGRPVVGFARVGTLDGLAHLSALAVVPGSMRRGLGTALLDAACQWAREQGYPAITLTTFADVAWNGPFYAARGFVPVDEPEPNSGPELRAVRERERSAGLDDAGRRIVMRRPLPIFRSRPGGSRESAEAAAAASRLSAAPSGSRRRGGSPRR